MFPKIKNGAILIADAHENDRRDFFYHFLQKIDSKEIETTQLFFMGDMFDLLIGGIEYSIEKHKKYIDLIDKISLHVEVFYFEGNHDFALKDIFQNVQVISIQNQPMKFILEDETPVILSHGDKYSGFAYGLYSSVIRSTFVLTLLNFIDKRNNNFISKKIENDQFRKNICYKMDDFKSLIKPKLANYSSERQGYIVEGHYHQNQRFTIDEVNYINLSSFACNKSYFIVDCYKKDKFTQTS